MLDLEKCKISLQERGFYCLTKAAGFAKVWAQGAGFFFLYIGNSANRTFEQQILINQEHIKQCLLSNRTIECALLISLVLYNCFWKPQKEFRKTIKKIVGCRILMKKRAEMCIGMPPPPPPLPDTLFWTNQASYP